MQLSNLGANKELNLANFSHDMLVRMCILSGCDYLDNLSGVGIKTAYKLVKKYKYTEKVGFRVSMFDNTF